MMNEQKESTPQRGMDLLKVNNLKYTLPPAVSVVTTRTLQKYPALSQEYNQGQTATVRVETGQAWVDASNSFIEFTITTAAAAKLNRGGSALDAFRETSFVSRSGVEIFRNQRQNVWHNAVDRWMKSPDWFESQGSAAGYNDDAADDLAGGITYTVPLAMVSDIFASGKLLPPQLMAGARLDFFLDSADVAFQCPAATTFTISNMNLHLTTVTLSDQIDRQLMRISAEDGLEMMFTAYSHVEDATGVARSRATLNAAKAVGRANMAVVSTRLDADVGAAAANSLAPATFTVATARARLGSLLFPQQELTEKKAMFMYALSAFQKHSSYGNCAVNYKANFIGGDNAVVGAGANCGVMAFPLERSEHLLSSGLSTDAGSGNLIVESSYDAPITATINLFLTFERVLRIGLSGDVIVRE